MTESEAVERHAFRAERTDDEVVLRFPSLNRLVRAFLPAEAVKQLYAAQREQLLAARSVLDAVSATSKPPSERTGPVRHAAPKSTWTSSSTP